VFIKSNENNLSHKKEVIRNQLKALGPLKYEERLVGLVFIITALLWITRSFFLKTWLPAIDDTIIAIFAAFVLFILPSSKGNQKLIQWKDAVQLPWGILILFGGGIALAVAFQQSGLALWIADGLSSMDGIALAVVIITLVAMVNFLTEITSNLATTSVILPVLASLAIALNVHPFMLMVAATMAASCAFMLPVATPPNAIVFGSEHVELKDMMKVGLWMNLISILLISLLIYFLLPVIWGIDPMSSL
jgi:sodium-dependent dicarboxylate transporter 2/3/5